MNKQLYLNIKFNDKLLWLISYFIISLSFIFFANDNSLPVLVKMPLFYADILFAVSVTFTTGFYLKKLNEKLNKTISWQHSFKGRLLKQFLYGVLIPLFVAMALEVFYLYCINISIAKSAILNLELPLAFIFLVLINLVYLVTYLLKNKQKETVTEKVFVKSIEKLEFIKVQKGYVEEKIEINKCAYIKSANKLLWLQTFDGEKYRLQGTLEEWELKLSTSNFYRINRQYLAASKAIKSVEQTATRKLKVNFILPSEEVYISKPNVASFRQWWKQ
ncbi:MAG: LytTR family DNA-binding domain-containing protein [Ferruginibacter sp.]|nr:LytTR family transcriptional regulator [Ferruginibacter sp.]